MSAPTLAVDRLTHRYGEWIALDGVSFEVEAGELFGLLGPNGSGKTTLVKVLATLLHPTGGSAAIAGRDVVRDRGEVRRRIGVVFQQPGLDLQLTPRENLRHQGHLYGMRGEELSARIELQLERMGTAGRADDRVKTLSGGLRRRVELAKGLLHDPAVLLLDEPTVGLDPGGRRELWDHLADLRADSGATSLVATHLMEEAERCDRIGILDRGRLVALGSPDELKRAIRGDVVALDSADPRGLAAAVEDRFGLEAVVVDGAVRLEIEDGAAFVPRLAEAFPGRIDSITVGKPTLEDVFVHETGRPFEERTAGRGRPEREPEVEEEPGAPATPVEGLLP
ncbi:MAG: ABC transporter ATP-binding protein [Gemmatimonadota bacterium]|nr:ABC transporter ATP-binding protein [Gemmatimonadota bacterium]